MATSIFWIFKYRWSRWDVKNLLLKVMLKMAKNGFRCNFHYLIFLMEFFHIPWIHDTLEAIITKKFIENHQFSIYIIVIKNSITCSISPTCTPLALSSRICRLFLEKNCQHVLLGFVDQCGHMLLVRVYIYLFLTHALFLSTGFLTRGVIIVLHTYVLSNVHRTWL